MSTLTARDLFTLARMMIREAKLLKSEGSVAEARQLARRAQALSHAGWRRLEAMA